MSIPIRINPFFWLITGLISWSLSNSFIGILFIIPVIFFSVLFHEYGHALTALLFGQKAEITLNGFGGLTTRTGSKLKLWQEFLIVLNGPLVSFCIYLIAIFASEGLYEKVNMMTIQVFQITALLNLLWTIFNLIPIQPLDGGHLFKIVMEGIFGYKGIQASAIFSLSFSVVLGFYFVSNGNMLIGFIFLLLAYENYISWKSISNMSQNDQDQNLWDELHHAQAAFKEHDYEKSLEILNDLKVKTDKGMIYLFATQLIGNVLFIQHKYAEAYDEIKPILKKITPEFFKIAQQIAFKAGDFDKSVDLGKVAYQEEPDIEVALVNALSHAAKGEVIPAVGWLKRIEEQGTLNFSEIIQRKEFDLIRHDPSFQELTK